MYHPDIVDMFKSLLSNDKPTVELSYDTTFNLGDFYLLSLNLALQTHRLHFKADDTTGFFPS